MRKLLLYVTTSTCEEEDLFDYNSNEQDERK